MLQPVPQVVATAFLSDHVKLCPVTCRQQQRLVDAFQRQQLLKSARHVLSGIRDLLA